MAVSTPYFYPETLETETGVAGRKVKMDIGTGSVVTEATLRLSYTIHKDAAGFPNPGYYAAPLKLIDRVKVRVNGTDDVWNIKGTDLFTICHMTHGRDPYGYRMPTFVGAETEKTITIDIPMNFVPLGLIGMLDAGLDLRRANSAEVEVEFANDIPAAIWSAPAGATVSDVTVKLTVERSVNALPAAKGEALMVREFVSQIKTFANDINPDVTRFNKGADRLYRRLAIIQTRGGWGCYTTNDNAARRPIYTGQVEIKAGPNPFSDVDFRHHVARRTVSSDAPEVVGLTVIDFSRFHQPSMMINSNELDDDLVIRGQITGEDAANQVHGRSTAEVTYLMESLRSPGWNV